ncbi:glycosyl hydrolase family 28-related protein [Emticicia sp. C21]|uniref:glycosyl hydrolase family 28-related protein n=1 Tax=Emticicia sp. C21 TaxID=2302915 RepID=UPI000E34A8FE|nr:glycosyl hydrolase family 28-related protein [Emticicia sp. C21]RFS17022.1 hypothetical protein D0T08_10110 [Emticicia sp. C21]
MSIQVVSDISTLRTITGSSNDVADVLGYYAVNDGGGGQFYWDAASTATDNGGTVIQATGVSTGRWLRIVSDEVSVRWFGAKGDGATDDSMAIQKAIDYCAISLESIVYFPKGTYIANDNLYLYNKVSLCGNSKEYCIIKLTDEIPYAYWVVIGTDSYGGSPNVWTGSIRNLSFDVNTSIQIALSIHLGKNCSIENCIINSHGLITNKLISGNNNADYVIPNVTYPRDNVVVRDNVLYMSSTDGESIGFGGRSKNILIDNNSILGAAGDDLGLHFVENVVVQNNYIETFNGRIYVSNSRNIKILYNKIIHTNLSESGMGILVEVESVATPRVCENISIIGNEVIYQSSSSASNYGIRIKSGRNVLIKDNALYNLGLNPNTLAQILVENQTLTGFVDPTLIDPSGNAYSRNITIVNNRCDGSINLNAAYDANKIIGNIAKNYTAIQDCIFKDNVFTGTQADNAVSGSHFYQNDPLPTFSGSSLGSSYVKLKMGNGGFEYIFRKNVRLTNLDVAVNAPLTAGFYQINIYKNGSLLGTRSYSTTGTNSGNAQVTTGQTQSTYDFAKGDVLYFEAKCNNGTPTTNDISLTVNCIEFD